MSQLKTYEIEHKIGSPKMLVIDVTDIDTNLDEVWQHSETIKRVRVRSNTVIDAFKRAKELFND